VVRYNVILNVNFIKLSQSTASPSIIFTSPSCRLPSLRFTSPRVIMQRHTLTRYPRAAIPHPYTHPYCVETSSHVIHDSPCIHSMATSRGARSPGRLQLITRQHGGQRAFRLTGASSGIRVLETLGFTRRLAILVLNKRRGVVPSTDLIMSQASWLIHHSCAQCFTHIRLVDS
jgi:hypothetical protein